MLLTHAKLGDLLSVHHIAADAALLKIRLKMKVMFTHRRNKIAICTNGDVIQLQAATTADEHTERNYFEAQLIAEGKIGIMKLFVERSGDLFQVVDGQLYVWDENLLLLLPT